MRNVIISPHIDDAILSIGGTINMFIQDKIPFDIVYVFTISDWINPDAICSDHVDLEKNIQVISNLRKYEEVCLQRLINHKFSFLDYEDYPLRKLYTEDMVKVMINSIMENVSANLSNNVNMYFPIGSHHPDHIILREIGMILSKKHKNIFFYEDMPHFASIARNYTEFYHIMISNGFKPIINKIDNDKKVEFLRFYKSQVSYDWINTICNYSLNVYDNSFFERYWVRKRQ